ncbi:MAG: PEP-CTERM sorting domain-containing protein [Candidatus Tectimicrobiota bacterium]
MNRLWRIVGNLMGALLLWIGAADADLITDPTLIPSPHVLTFDGVNLFGPAVKVPVGVGLTQEVRFSTLHGDGLLGEAPSGAWGLDSNGLWSLGKTFAGVDGDVAADGSVAIMLFDFAGKTVQHIGGFFNYSPDFTYDAGPFGFLPLPLYLAVLDAAGNVLEDQELPIFTPDAVNASVFYGFRRPSADIAQLVVSGPYAVVDDLTFSTPVPEPASLALLGLGLGVLSVCAARRQRSSVTS